MNDALLTAIRTVLSLLVDGSYDVIEAMTRSRRLTAREIRGVVETYGRTLSMAPGDDLWAPDLIVVEGAFPVVVLASVDLWTEEDGRSDLTLELRLTELYEGAYDIEVIDLHVL
jgi:hypothetical protein